MKLKKNDYRICLASLLSLILSLGVSAQESRLAPTKLSKEIDGVKILIEEYKELQSSFEKDLRSNARRLEELNLQIDESDPESEEFQTLQLEYRYVYANALRSRIDQLKQLENIALNIERGIERALESDMQSNNQARIVAEAVEHLLTISEQAELDRMNSIVLSDYINDLGNQQILSERALLTNNTMPVIEREKARLEQLSEQINASPDAHLIVSTKLRRVRQTIGLASTRIGVTLTRLDAVRKVLLASTEIMIEFNNINEMTSKFNEMIHTINSIEDISATIDDDLPMPNGLLFPLLQIEQLNGGTTSGSAKSIDVESIKKSAKSKFVTETEN